MLKYYLLCFVFVFSFINPHSSYSYNFSANSDTDGTITIVVKRTSTVTDQDGKIVGRGMENFSYSSKISADVYYSSLDDYKQSPNISQPVIPLDGDLPTVVRGNNDFRTFDPQGVETTYNGQPVSRTEISYSYHGETYSLDPCDSSGTPKLILIGEVNCSGEFHKASVAIDLFRENEPGDGFRLRVLTGGLPFQWGGDKLVCSKKRLMQVENSEGKMECKWIGNEAYAAFPPEPSDLTPQIGDKRMGKRSYSSASNGITKDIHMLGMDTSEFFNYLKKHPPTQTFNLTGYYHEVSSVEGETGEATEECTALLQLGLVKNDLEISGKDDDEYHKWMPLDKDNPDAKSFHAKAKLTTSDKVKEDTLYFSLEDVSHYKGVCSNFPSFPANSKPDVGLESDMVFSKSQDDPNVKYIDSFNVKTNKKVTEAYVTIECRDYAAYGKLKVRTLNIKDCENKYDGKKYLTIPEDYNDNKIADAWESDKDVNILSKNYKRDWDEEGDKGTLTGDDIPLWEEYRGFITLDESGNRYRKFKRLDPNKREIFVVDENNSTNAKDWENASDVKMIYLGEEMINKKFYLATAINDPDMWRIVDFNGDRKKKAIYVKTYPGISDPYCLLRSSTPTDGCDYNENGVDADGNPVWMNHICFYEGCTGMLNFFPARIEQTIKTYPQFVVYALDNKPEHVYFREVFDELAKNHGMTHDQLETKANVSMKKWDSQNAADLVKQVKRFVMVHEMGHACKVDGHIRKDPGDKEEHESTRGVESCPMAYVLFSRKMEMVIFSDPDGIRVSPMFGKTRFCNSDDNCYSHLDAKNK